MSADNNTADAVDEQFLVESGDPTMRAGYGVVFRVEIDTDSVRSLSPNAVRMLLVRYACQRGGTDADFAQIAGLTSGEAEEALGELVAAGLAR